MALIIRSPADLSAIDDLKLRSRVTYQVYNGLDAAITKGVWDNLYPKLDEDTGRVYRFSLGMQGPAMSLQVRGIRVDEKRVWKAIKEVEEREARAAIVLNKLAEVWWGKGLNPRSPQQLKPFLYEVLKLPPQRDKKGKISTGIEAIETLQKKAPQYWTILRPILRLRELRKQLGFLRARRSADGAMRASFNVGATETGRWSSSKNAFGEGLNFQNVFKSLRYIFIPRPGLRMANADLKTAESMLVAYLSGDPEYIKAHLSFDTHTYVAKLIWPEAGWTGDPEHDKELAKKPGFYRHFSMRDLAKRVQHGSNYGASEFALARILHIPLQDARDLLNKYKRQFPGIFAWQERRKLELRKFGKVPTALRRWRQFYDRVWENSTQREAIAHEPQSLVGDILNIGLYRIWREMHGDGMWILNQGHDAVLFEYEPKREDEILERVTTLLRVEVPINGQTIVIPADVGTGANWLEAADPDKWAKIAPTLN